MIGIRRTRSTAQPDEHGVVLGVSRMRFDDSGMYLEKAHSSIRHGWAV